VEEPPPQPEASTMTPAMTASAAIRGHAMLRFL
jgi:hypothetical protein